MNVGSPYVPPDANGAAGPSHYVELVNGRYSVYSKAGGALLQTMTDRTFWLQSGVKLPGGWDVTDPRVIYDSGAQRWFAVQIDFDVTGLINTNHFLIAVSTNADPTGPWKAFSISTSPGQNDNGDFPTLGVDSQGVYLAAEMFDASNNDVGASVLSIPKSDLLASTPTVANRTWLGISTDRGVILQPAVSTDGSANGAVLATGGLGFDYVIDQFTTNTTLIGFAIDNAGGPAPATLGPATTNTVPPYTTPNDPVQPDGTDNLDDGNARLSAFVYGVGGILYAVHSTQMGNHAALRWYRISASNYAVLESGTISDPNLDLFYPSIAASSNGTIVIACNGSSINTFVSSYAAAGETVNGATTFGDLVLLKAGVASYQDGGAHSRWGDYSATCVDPADPTRFWTIQTYVSATNVWSTQITELLTCPLCLNITPSGTNVQISWTTLATGFALQSTADLSGSSSWSTVNQMPVTNGNVVSVLIPITGARQFFRLSNGP